MLHVDDKKLGNIPDGGGWRYIGRRQGDRNRSATPGKGRYQHHHLKMGHAFVHTVIDDYSRIAYAEVHDDETALTATAVLRDAIGSSSSLGVVVVISAMGPCGWRLDGDRGMDEDEPAAAAGQDR